MTKAGSYRLEVDGTRCDAYGMCALVCSERVSLDPWGYAVIDPAPISDARILARARRAAIACPAAALAVRRVGSEVGSPR